MNVFAQIRKVDEAKRLVFGRAAEEVVDKSGEIMDYSSTKPHFQKWSAEVQADTDGKSLGNLRAMHGKVAAGKLTDIVFDDEAKAIDVVAKVVDDQEWKKVLEGVYTGFSIGGAYVGESKVEKINGQEVKRYTAKPSELSLVDRPCIPTAKFFEVQKADGSAAQVAFREPDAAAEAQAAASKQAEKAEAEDQALDVTGTPDDILALGKLINDSKLTVRQAIDLLGKAVAERKDTSAKEGTSEYGDVKFADSTNKKYPIDTEEHIRAAWNYINKGKNADKYSAKDVAAIKARIVAAWKSKIDKEGPPSASEKAEDAPLQKVEFTPELRKSLCGALCGVLDQLMYLRQSAAYEAFQEGDNSPLPGRIDAVIALTAQVLQEAVAEATSEIKAGTEAGSTEPGEPVEMAEKYGALLKADADPMATLLRGVDKAAAPTLAKLLQPAEAAPAAAAADLQKLVADAVAPLKKALDEAAAKIEHLEKQPAPAKVSLRAVSKAADKIEEHHQPAQQVAPVRDGLGKVNESASLIKQIHQQGGRPINLRVG
jgi:hypothetical protein